MHSKTLLFVLTSLEVFTACKRELNEPYQGYFFIQNTNQQTFTLYINDEIVGDLEETTQFPIICVDSTLVQTTQIPITHRKNDFVLVNALGEIVTDGSFKIERNGTSSESLSNIGSTYIKFFDNRVVVGFNILDNPILNDPARDCD